MKTFIKIFLFLALGIGLYWFAFHQTPEQKNFAKTLAEAEQENGEAMLRVGDLYLEGKGTEPNAAQAEAWYRKALTAGSTEAAWKLAQVFIQGKTNPSNLEEAVVYLQVAAQEENAEAQNELGRFYEKGLGGLTAHAGQGLYWRILSAQNGNPKAVSYVKKVQRENPTLYEQEMAFLQDIKLAREGDGSARLRVAQVYQAGDKIAADDKEAEKWLSLAWQENKLPQAGYELAQIYLDTASPLADESKGVALLGELAQQAYPQAQYALGERAYKEEPPNYKDAFAWFSNAASTGYAPAQYMTGFMLMQGQGMTRSVPLSIKFFRDAAEQDYSSAQYVLGQIYYKGLGVSPDKKAGKMWLDRAVENGSVAAQAFLESLRS